LPITKRGRVLLLVSLSLSRANIRSGTDLEGLVAAHDAARCMVDEWKIELSSFSFLFFLFSKKL